MDRALGETSNVLGSGALRGVLTGAYGGPRGRLNDGRARRVLRGEGWTAELPHGPNREKSSPGRQALARTETKDAGKPRRATAKGNKGRR